jgi:hypothetical protein
MEAQQQIGSEEQLNNVQEIIEADNLVSKLVFPAEAVKGLDVQLDEEL